MTDPETKINRVHFGGGSWMVVTYGAALTEIEKERKRPDSVFAETIEWSGTSAGAWTLLFYMLNIPIEKQMATTDKYAQVATQMLRDTGSISLTEVHFQWLLEIHRAYPEAYKVMNDNRCSIYVATKSNGIIRRSNFTSNLDLFNTMLCSSHIPYLCTYGSAIPLAVGSAIPLAVGSAIPLAVGPDATPDVGGRRPNAMGGRRPNAMDGGIGFDMKRDLGGDVATTMTIACANPEYDINFQCPTFWMIFPPPEMVRNYYFRRGRDMTADYFRERRAGSRGMREPAVNFTNHVATQISHWFETPDENKIVTDVWWFVREHQTITHTVADLERRMSQE